jgi:predicted Zn-dependent peptidase
MEVILIENPSCPVVAATAVVRAGADLETDASFGSSHMMEHLLFNGTSRRSQKELYDEADLYGIYNNATTRRFHTDYFVLAPKDRIRKAMDIQTDMLFHSTFPEENFAKEKGIVLAELGKDEQDSGYLAENLFRAIAFAGTPYARPILGTTESITRLSRSDVVRYHQTTYVPNNMVLFVMGGFDADSLLPVIDTLYGAPLPREIPDVSDILPPALPAGGSLRVFHGKTERGVLSIALGAPPGSDPRATFFDALTLFLGERLSEDLAEEQGAPLFGVGASYERRKSFGRLILSATFDPARPPEEIVNRILEGVRRLAASEPSAGAIAGFSVSSKTAELYLAERPHMYGMDKAEALAIGGYEEMERFLRALDSLDPGTVREGLAGIDTRNYLAVALLSGEPDYAPADLAIRVPGEEAIWGRSFAPKEKTGALTVLRAPAGETAAASARSERVDTTLANGLRILVESNDDSKVFAIHMLAKNRSWQEPKGLEGVADLLHRLLPRGTQSLSGPELRAALDRIGAEVKVCDDMRIPFDDYYTTPSFSFVRFTTIDEFAAAGLDLFAEMVRRPSLAEGDIDPTKKMMATLATGRESKPADLAGDLLDEALYKDTPRAASPGGTASSIGAITREDLAAFHRIYFAPDNLILSVVTSLPAREVAASLARRFADAEPYAERKPSPPEIAPTTKDESFERPLGASQGALRIGYVVAVPPEERAALYLAASLLSDEIAFYLRETLGLAYNVGAHAIFDRGNAAVLFSIGVAPENLDRVEAAVRERFDRFGKEPEVRPRDIERMENAIFTRMNMRRLSRQNQAFRLGYAAFAGDERDWVDELRGLAPDDVARAARKYIRSSPSVTVRVR